MNEPSPPSSPFEGRGDQRTRDVPIDNPAHDRNIWLCSALYLGLQKIPAHVILNIPHA